MPNKWSEQADTALRDGLDAGMTFAEVTASINAKCGTSYSKQAVTSRAKRIRAKNRNPSGKYLITKKREYAPLIPLAPAAPSECKPVSLLDLRHFHCRALLTDENDHPRRDKNGIALFCGALVSPGSSWCPEHRKQYVTMRTYQPRRPPFIVR